MSDEEIPIYDLEQVYDEKIAPLMTQIIAICKEHRMPMIASFQYANTDENGVAYCTTFLAGSGVCHPGASMLMRAIDAMRPRRPFALAETIVTQPDGSKEITIRRVT